MRRSLLRPALALALGAGGAAAAAERSVVAVLDECRSADAFFRERAEGELRRRSVEALPALAGALSDPDRGLRLRLWRVFRDGLRAAIDEAETHAASQLRDAVEQA
ncbi:MAG: hypothetical protein ACRD2T_15940, partial [Thermoanaerobaculia bacterium]